MAQKVVANNILFDQAAQFVATGKEVEVPTKGNSMFPFIVGGKDSLILTSSNSLKVGDIVLAKINDTNYVVHRIISIENEKVTLMGDGNIAGREYCTPQQIFAKVKFIVHRNIKIDCNSNKQRRRAQLWRKLLPIRRYILGVWRRTPFYSF
ncbi:MAG: S24/S26 family peptidase [Rikenellaceae bacterium]